MNVVDIAQPRGELPDILEGGHRDERLHDIVLGEGALERVLEENRARAALEAHGVQPRRRLSTSTVLLAAARGLPPP